MNALILIYVGVACIALPLLIVKVESDRRMKRLYKEDRDWWKEQAEKARAEADDYFNRFCHEVEKYDSIECHEAILASMNKHLEKLASTVCQAGHSTGRPALRQAHWNDSHTRG